MHSALHIIQDEHRNLWRIAITLDRLGEDIAGGGALEPAFLLALFDYLEHFVDAAHHRKEDEHLFACLRQRDASAIPLLDALQAEHREAPARVQALRQQLADCLHGQGPASALAQGLRGYADGLKSHIRREEQQVFPLAEQALSAADWDAIRSADDESLVNTLCAVCPFTTAERQALLDAQFEPARPENVPVLWHRDTAAPDDENNVLPFRRTTPSDR